MAIAFLADFRNGVGSVASITLTVPAGGIPAGSLVVVHAVAQDGTIAMRSVVDARGNIYSPIPGLTALANGVDGNLTLYWSFLSVALQAGDLLTLDCGSASSGVQGIAAAFSGVANHTPDAYSQFREGSSELSPHTSGTLTTTQADELLIGAHLYRGNGTGTWTPGGSFALTPLGSYDPAAYTLSLLQYRVVSSIGSYDSSGTTGTSQSVRNAIAAFKADIGADVGPPPQLVQPQFPTQFPRYRGLSQEDWRDIAIGAPFALDTPQIRKRFITWEDPNEKAYFAFATPELVYSETAEVYVDIQASSSEIQETVDSATVYLDLQVGTVAPSVITVDQLNLGELIETTTTSSTSLLTTLQPVAPGATIILTASWFTAGSTVLQGVSGGSLTWVIDKQITSAGGECAAVISAYAPSGLPAGTVLTFDYGDTASAERLMTASSYLGISSTNSTKINRSDSALATYTTTWAAPTVVTDTPTLIVGMACVAGFGNPTSTPTGAWTEAHDINAGAGHQHAQIVEYQIGSPGTYTPAGTWSANESSASDRKQITVAYNAEGYHTTTFIIANDGDDGTGWWRENFPYTWPPTDTGFWNDDVSITTIFVGKGQNGTGGGSYQYANNGFWRWDTSSIPDAANPVGAVFQPYLRAGAATAFSGFSFTGDYYDFGGEPTVAADGILQVASSIFTPVALSTLVSTGYKTFPLTNVSGISTTGYTGIRCALDEGGTVSGAGESQTYWEPHESALGREAQLIVSYYLPTGPVDIFLPVDSATVYVDLQSSGTDTYTPPPPPLGAYVIMPPYIV